MMGYLTNENNILLGHKFNVESPVEKEITITISDDGVFEDLEDEVKAIINTYVTGGSIDFAVLEYVGLNLGVQLHSEDLKENIRTVFPSNDYPCDLTITITDDGVFSDDENKYKITSIVFDRE